MSQSQALRHAIFLDRDGTINKEVNYLCTPDQFELLAGAAETIAWWNTHNWIVVLVTNQAGIGRGLFSRQDLEAVHKRMTVELSRRGAHLDAIYYCPHHPDEGCKCRKPGTLLFEQAAEELGIDLKKSFLIGDKLTDVLPARQLGANAILVKTGYGEEESRHLPLVRDFKVEVVADLSAAKDLIIGRV